MATTDATSTTSTTNPWFTLTRHEDAPSDAGTGEATEQTSEDDDSEAEELLADAVDDSSADDADEAGGSDEPDGADQLGDAGKRALDRMKQERNEAARQLKQMRRDLAAATKRLTEFEDRDKSELEKAGDKVSRAEERAGRLQQRLVQAEVKVLAAGDFADPSDAQAFLGDLSRYIDGDGDVDTVQIQADLADLLDAKPHLRRPAPEPAEEPKKAAKPKPKPDPGQGGRGDKAVDFRTASREEVDAELARMGVVRRR